MTALELGGMVCGAGVVATGGWQARTASRTPSEERRKVTRGLSDRRKFAAARSFSTPQCARKLPQIRRKPSKRVPTKDKFLDPDSERVDAIFLLATLKHKRA